MSSREETQRKKEDERRELAAMMLVDAAFDKDEVVAKRYGKGVSTLERYRAQLATDPILRGMVEARLRERRAAWAEQLPEVLGVGLDTIRRMFLKLREDPAYDSNPGALKEVADSVYKVAEIELTLRDLNAGTQGQSAEERGEARGAGEASERVC